VNSYEPELASLNDCESAGRCYSQRPAAGRVYRGRFPLQLAHARHNARLGRTAHIVIAENSRVFTVSPQTAEHYVSGSKGFLSRRNLREIADLACSATGKVPSFCAREPAFRGTRVEGLSSLREGSPRRLAGGPQQAQPPAYSESRTGSGFGGSPSWLMCTTAGLGESLMRSWNTSGLL